MSTWWEQGRWKGCLGWNLGTYSSCVTWESQKCQDSDGFPFKFSLLHAHPWMDTHLQGQFLRIKRRKSGFFTELLCYPGPACQSFWATVSTSEKHIRWDDLQSPPEAGTRYDSPPLRANWIRMECRKGWRRKERGSLRWHSAGLRCPARAPCLMSAFYQGMCALCPGLAWPLHPSSFCSSGFGKEPVDVETQQTGFLPKSCLDGETEPREIFCFVFYKLQWLLSTEHTVTHAHTHSHPHMQKHNHIHKQNRMFSLLLSLESQAISYRLRHFHQGWIAPLR